MPFYVSFVILHYSEKMIGMSPKEMPKLGMSRLTANPIKEWHLMKGLRYYTFTQLVHC